MMSVQEATQLINTNLDSKNRDETVLKVIKNTNVEMRLQICDYYAQTYGKSLYSELKSKLSSNFKDLAMHSFLHPLTYAAKLLKKNLASFFCDETLIFDIFTSYTLEELRLIEAAFKIETGKDLIKQIEKYFSGVLKKNLINLLTTERRVNNNPEKEKCEKFANVLIDVGEANWAGDENIFKEIFIQNSPEELILIGRYYFKITGNNMIDVIEQKLTGKNKNLLREIFYNNIIPQELYAEKIYLAIKGLGTNNTLLNRILIARNEIDMDEIKDFYQQKYNKPMKKDIIGDTNGIYRELCLILAHC